MASSQKLQEESVNDYSCYIYINNTSDYDLLLADAGIKDDYGEWPKGQPANTIDARSEGMVQLKDKKGAGGTEGWVKYEVQVGDRKGSFVLEFADPQTPWSNNYLRGRSNDPKMISLSIKNYADSGHPFTGNVDVYIIGSTTASDGAERDSHRRLCNSSGVVDSSRQVTTTKPAEDQNATFQAKFDVGFDAGLGGLGKKYPIHESIAIASFIKSKVPLPSGTTYNNLNSKQWEYIRGLIWNDDPSCYLFNDNTDNNHDFGKGAQWLWDFKMGDPTCMIQRSHFGNMQFLHAMGAHPGEKPETTQTRLVRWSEVMYKLACGNQGVSEGDKLSVHLGEHFDVSTTPSGDSTLRQLLLASTPGYWKSNVAMRAIGSCMHIIQDSYAIGHTQRRLMNPNDLDGRDEENYIRFKPGTYGNWGPIVVFHTYSGQDTDRHTHYDGLEGVSLPSPKDLNSFNPIIGARNAIDACTKLLDCYAKKTPWDNGVKKLLETEIFALDSEPNPSNPFVDEVTITSTVNTPCVGSTPELEYEAGLQRKMAMVETGMHAGYGNGPMRRRRLAWKYAVPSGLLTMLVIGVAAIFAYLTLRIH